MELLHTNVNDMDITNIIRISNRPKVFEKGTNQMWTDPYISKNLIEIHLNPEVNLASRKPDSIHSSLDWILNFASVPKLNILDLGCGPGLYAEELAKRGHKITGIDFSENSIYYAKEQAKINGYDIDYIVQNYLEIDYQNQFDLVILIYTDFCVLLPAEQELLLSKIKKALKPGGVFAFDFNNDRNLDQKVGAKSWEAVEQGFWSPEPYLWLSEPFHYPEKKVLLFQHTVIQENKTPKVYRFWTQYYSMSDMAKLLDKNGFKILENSDKVLPEEDCWLGNNISFVIAGCKE
ncbi:class I SAM-dependent methyltransferase [Marinifilum sp. D737]|uniref:class I SAM-dependent methyltransferase n=1 Tax=Marinifilum sp. D737 TaxID=2969628 RepID=UPI002273D594|nr:class I SAM-dependent methyltransferase [Marinifilum sp. D737]MCY1634665.1 class I SAM-dependent methyltransferase [Marinifilum sp. D737]